MFSRAEYFKRVAQDEGYIVVHTPQYGGHEGPFPQLHNPNVERDWTINDWEGAARDVGWPFDDTPEDEVDLYDVQSGSGGKETP